MSSFEINSTETVKEEAPEFINFTDADRKAMRSFATLRPGWMLLEVLSESRRVVPKSGNLEITYDLAPVDKNGEVVKGLKTRLRVIPPVTNPGRPGHVAPNTKLGAYFFGLATEPAFPRYPKKLRPGVYELANGDVVTQEQATLASEEVNTAIEVASMRWYNERNGMVGKRFYGHNEHQTGDDGRIWCSVDRTSATAPTDPNEVLIVEDFAARV